MRRVFIISILVCALFASVAPGCASTETPPAPPITVELSFPDGAPPLNQEAELIYIMEVMEPGCILENISIEIRLPEGFELVSGELSWFGDISSGDELEVIRATVRAVKTGNWTIESRCAINPEKQCGISVVPGWHPAIYVSVSEDSAEWGITPPWYEGGGHPVEIEQED